MPKLKQIVEYLDCEEGLIIRVITRVNTKLEMDWLVTPILKYPYYQIYPPK